MIEASSAITPMSWVVVNAKPSTSQFIIVAATGKTSSQSVAIEAFVERRPQ